MNETQLVLWNEAKNPGLTATAKLRRGTRLALTATANDKDSHKDMPSDHRPQIAKRKRQEGKDDSKARKGQRPMELTRVIRNVGNGTYVVRHAGQGAIVNSQDTQLRVDELATRIGDTNWRHELATRIGDTPLALDTRQDTSDGATS
jgi:hypothetical protein